MKTKDKFITFILCTIVLCIYVVANSYSLIDKKINRVYKVYLDGEVIGTIENKDDLYSLIDEKQQSIKDKYDVENVYPPNGLEVIETYSYNASSLSIVPIFSPSKYTLYTCFISSFIAL